MTADGRGSVAREAFVLPLLLLTVALLGGLRLEPGSAALRFLPPPLVALVLAVVLMGAMARARLLVPDGLVGGPRTGLESASGGVVLLALLLATAQVVSGLSPEAGLLRVAYYFVFTVLVWNTVAAGPDRRRLLHSLFVILGAALVFKHVLLAALFDPEGGLVKRLVLAVLEGASLGTLEAERLHEGTGYVAFLNALLYVLGLSLLPAGTPTTAVTVLARPGTSDVVEAERSA